MKNGTAGSDKSAYLSVRDAADHLGVSIYYIYELIKDSDGPPCIKIITKRKPRRPLIRLPKKEFFDWAKQQEK